MKTVIPKLLILVFIAFRFIPSTGAYFSDTVVINTSFSTGSWQNPPVSQITTKITDNFCPISKSYLTSISSQTPYTINYSISPPEAFGTQVKLCYSYKLEPFNCDGPYLSSNGHFNFDFPQGPGLYLFETRAYSGSDFVESKILNPHSLYILTKYFSINYLGLPLMSFRQASAPISPSVSYDQNTSILTLTIKNIPDSIDSLDYEITYNSQGLEQGIYGQFLPEEVISGQVVKQVYLGTCSQNSCLPHTLDDPSIHLNFAELLFDLAI
jgi:predicted ribosomally synthesized peptide with SipW-like signal peptide